MSAHSRWPPSQGGRQERHRGRRAGGGDGHGGHRGDGVRGQLAHGVARGQRPWLYQDWRGGRDDRPAGRCGERVSSSPSTCLFPRWQVSAGWASSLAWTSRWWWRSRTTRRTAGSPSTKSSATSVSFQVKCAEPPHIFNQPKREIQPLLIIFYTSLRSMCVYCFCFPEEYIQAAIKTFPTWRGTVWS